MKKFILALILLIPFISQAKEMSFYAGAGYQYGMFDDDVSSVQLDADVSNIKFEAGMYFHKNFAVEANFVLGITDDEIKAAGVATPITIEVNYVASLFLKGDLNLSKMVSLYGLIGVSKGEVESKAPGFSADSSETSLSLGAGIEAEVYKNLNLHLEYVMYYGDLDGINLGFTYNF